MLRACLLVLALAAQGDPKPLPEAPQFLAEVRKKLHTNTRLLSQYTYTEKQTHIQLDGDQKPKKTEVNAFEVFPGSPERVGYRRKTVKDGVPLTKAELEKEDRELQKRIDSVTKKRAQRSPEEREKARAEAQHKEEEIMDDLFALYDTQLVRREDAAGLPAILVTFRPREGYKPKTRDGQNMQHFAGSAWISEDDHELARVEAEVIEPLSFGFGILAKLQKGAHIAVERQKFNDEIWLPVREEVVLSARILLLKGLNIRQILEFSDHKKYSVDTILKFPDVEKQQKQ